MKFGFPLVASLVLLTAFSPVMFGQSIERQLQQQLPTIVDYLTDHGYQNVGVLKFHVKKPDQPLSYDVGSLNSLMADRLEIGLIIANPSGSKTLRIIRDASSQVGEIDGANHGTPEGRAALFTHELKPAWGRRTIKPDVFLSGIVRVHDDTQRVTVAINCIDAEHNELTMIGDSFEADLEASHLSELGESFMLRGAFDGGSVKLRDDSARLTALKAANSVRKEQTTFPLLDDSAPVQFRILYNGIPQPVELRQGRAFVREPNQGDKVEFVVTRQSHVVDRLGVVLKVNGESTLYRQTGPDLGCSKWILSPEHPKTVIGGYQLDSGRRQDFTVLSSTASAARAMNYGRHTGQIQLTVFAEAPEAPTPQHFLDGKQASFENDLLAMVRGLHPAQPPADLETLQQQLRPNTPRTRGLIVEGQGADHNVSTVRFHAVPTPVMSVTITYYQ